jgi:hypothetical protein
MFTSPFLLLFFVAKMKDGVTLAFQTSEHRSSTKDRQIFEKICQILNFNFKKMFFGQCIYLSFQHTNNAYYVSHCTRNSTAMFHKNLIPRRDSNPGLLVPDTNAMSTAPHCQGKFQICSFKNLRIGCL